VSELALEPANLRTDARLGDVHTCCGSREAGLVRDRDEVLELSQFHSQPL
jgi:hypothetical protein